MKKNINDNLEKLTQAIQKKLDGNPVILTGSGSSIPYGLPSMNDLALEIMNKLNFQYQNDDTWKAFVIELQASKNLEVALGNVSLTDAIQNAVITTVWALVDKIDRDAISRFLKQGTFPALTLILKKFIQQTGTTNIVTTNYDRLVEYAIDSAKGVVETGFSGDCVKTFGYFPSNTTKRTIKLFKVHGSIDWFKHKTNHNILATSFYNPSILSDLYIPMIVTPGNNKYKETHNDPFRTVMAEADKALRNSTSYLCIGYGFNDEHIQPIVIDENRNKHKPIVIIAKDVTLRMKELFLQSDNYNCLIISENPSGGSIVHYSNVDQESFTENYWQLDSFYKLWFE